MVTTYIKKKHLFLEQDKWTNNMGTSYHLSTEKHGVHGKYRWQSIFRNRIFFSRKELSFVLFPKKL